MKCFGFKFVISNDVKNVISSSDMTCRKGNEQSTQHEFTIIESSEQENISKSFLITSKNISDSQYTNLKNTKNKISFNQNIGKTVLRHSFIFSKIIELNLNLSEVIDNEFRSELVLFLSGQTTITSISDPSSQTSCLEFSNIIETILNDVNNSVTEKSKKQITSFLSENFSSFETDKSMLFIVYSNSLNDIKDQARIYHNEIVRPPLNEQILKLTRLNKNPSRKLFLLFHNITTDCEKTLKLFAIKAKTKMIEENKESQNANPNEQYFDLDVKSLTIKKENASIKTCQKL